MTLIAGIVFPFVFLSLAIRRLLKLDERPERFVPGSVAFLEYYAHRAGYGRAEWERPFRNPYDWLVERIKATIRIWQHRVSTGIEADSCLQEVIADTEEQMMAISHLFSPDETDEPTMLHAEYLRESEILVDDDGKITGIVGWHDATAVPLWRGCVEPRLFRTGSYMHKYDHAPILDEYSTDPEHMLNGANELFWIHLEYFEKILLLRVFLAEMDRLEPEWTKERNDGEFRRDVEEHVCWYDGDRGGPKRYIQRWWPKEYNEIYGPDDQLGGWESDCETLIGYEYPAVRHIYPLTCADQRTGES